MSGNIKIGNKFLYNLLPDNLRTLKTSVTREKQNKTKIPEVQKINKFSISLDVCGSQGRFGIHFCFQVRDTLSVMESIRKALLNKANVSISKVTFNLFLYWKV